MMPRTLLLSSLLFGCALGAQQNVVWNANNTPTGGGNAFPWGSAGLRYQALVLNSLLGNNPAWIQDILVAGAATSREIIYDDIEIRMGMTPAATLTTAWATNNPNPTTVFRGYLRTYFETGAWRGVGLPASFLYNPTPNAPHLCIEIITWTVRGQTNPANFYSPPTDASVPRAFRYDWCNNQGMAPLTGSGGGKFGLVIKDGNYVLVGAGCNSSAAAPVQIQGPANAWPTLGSLFPVSLSGAASAGSFLLVGFSDTKLGPLPLPFDLAPLGAPGCLVWNDDTIVLGTATNGSGAATLQLAIPGAPALGGLRCFASWAQLDAGANLLGLTTSGQMKLIVSH